MEDGHPFERDFGRVAFNPVRHPCDHHPRSTDAVPRGTIKRVGRHLCALIKHLPELQMNQSEQQTVSRVFGVKGL